MSCDLLSRGCTAYAVFVLFCNLALPCILFYVLRNHTHMTLRELIGISSATLGVSSSFDGPFRTWKCESHLGEHLER